jgi:RNA polymerase sigma-70 factor (ECF subfamily)
MLISKRSLHDTNSGTESELLQKARNGSTRAFGQLFERYDKHVFGIALDYMQSSDDAKDVYQEVFIRAYHGLASFQSKSQLSTWIFRITVNVCLSQIARQKNRLQSPLDEKYSDAPLNKNSAIHFLQSERGADQAAMDSEILTQVEQAMRVLSPQQRMVFSLRHLEGYKLREIAVLMECSVGAVKRHLFIGTNRMRGQLKHFVK